MIQSDTEARTIFTLNKILKIRLCKKTQYKETALETVGNLFLTLHLVACIESDK